MAKTKISPRINSLLARLRGKIRRYVWLEGIAVAIIWLVATFWLSLAMDYLPVKMGANEMPVMARAILLVIVSLALLFILYRWVLRRAFVSLRRHSLAVLIERSYPEFEDSLVTTVELEADDDASELQQAMLRDAHDKAVKHIDNVRLGKVFNYGPLGRAMGLAALAIGSIILTACLSLPSLKMWASRIYGLSPDPYPRLTHLELEDFAKGQLTVARGSNVTIRVRSDANRKVPPPEVCTIYYTTENGERGRVNMSKKGTARDGFQNYTFDGKPFKGILGNVDFDIVGNDQRIRDQLVRVVDSPQIAAITIDCERPAYTQLSKTQIEYYPGVRVPQGSRLALTLKTNKPIAEASWLEKKDAEPVKLKPGDDPHSISLVIDSINQSISQEVTLLDQDGVASKRPYRISIAAIPDEPPNVDLRLSGIGTAVTPDVRIPVQGKITDEYGVARTWFEIEPQTDTWTPKQFELSSSSGDVESALDLRDERSKTEDPFELTVDSKIVFSVKSADHYDLAEDPNVGESDRYELEVVDANRLIALLEARELGLRRRFDQIIGEMKETRDSLSRVQYAPTVDETGLTEGEDGQSKEEKLERAAALRLLRVQRGEQYSQRAAQEVLGVALSFEDIRQELINNRVDATDRRNRIANDIVAPLTQVAEDMFPVLDGRLGRLRSHLEGSSPEDETQASAVSTVAQADQIVIALEAVLEKMLELETYNELVDLIRKMIRDQEDLTERTKEQQKKSALDLLN